MDVVVSDNYALLSELFLIPGMTPILSLGKSVVCFVNCL